MSDGWVRVLLARHGEAAYETEGVGDGGGSLTPLGRAQARSLGAVARREGVDAVWCSSLSRAVQTAEIAASVVGVPVTVREALVEFDVGEIRGLPYDATVIEPVMTSWLGGDVVRCIPGGESGREAALRVLDDLAPLVAPYAGRTVLAVCHGGVIVAVKGLLGPGAPGAPAHADDVPNGSAYEIALGADGWRWVGSVPSAEEERPGAEADEEPEHRAGEA